MVPGLAARVGRAYIAFMTWRALLIGGGLILLYLLVVVAFNWDAIEGLSAIGD